MLVISGTYKMAAEMTDRPVDLVGRRIAAISASTHPPQLGETMVEYRLRNCRIASADAHLANAERAATGFTDLVNNNEGPIVSTNRNPNPA